MPNVTSETQSSSSSSRSRSSSSRSSSSRSSRSRSRSMAVFSSCCCYAFWLPFPPAAAQIFAAAGSRMENTMEKITCRQGNTMPLKDGEAPKLQPENA